MKVIMSRYGKEFKPFYDDKIEVHEQFIYSEECNEGEGEEDRLCVLAIKINDDYCAVVNKANKFVLAKVFDSCISIRSTPEYNSFKEADEEINGKEKHPIIERGYLRVTAYRGKSEYIKVGQIYKGCSFINCFTKEAVARVAVRTISGERAYKFLQCKLVDWEEATEEEYKQEEGGK